jgi:WD40 repeat protein
VGIRTVALTCDGTLLAAGNSEGNCYVWSFRDGELNPERKVEAHPSAYMLKAVFSPDTRFVLRA